MNNEIFNFLVWLQMEEADLNFGIELKHGEATRYHLLDQLYPIKVLTVCSYMLTVWSLYVCIYIYIYIEQYAVIFEHILLLLFLQII